MNGTIKLANPIKINGAETLELSYDTNEITGAHFCEADRRKAAAGRGAVSVSVAEMDASLHFYLGVYAVIALNSHIDVTDLERARGYDAAQIMRIGRDFFTPPAEEGLPDGSLEDQSGITPEPTLFHSSGSKESD